MWGEGCCGQQETEGFAKRVQTIKKTGRGKGMGHGIHVEVVLEVWGYMA